MTVNLVVHNHLTGQRQREFRAATLDEVFWELNAPGGAMISCNPLRLWDDVMNILNKCEIWIWIDGVLQHVVVPRDVNGSLKKLTFVCEGIMSYLLQRHIRATLTYTSLDQFNIGWNLVNYAQTGANRDRRITASSFLPSGRVRSREYKRDEGQAVLLLLQEFPTLEQGYDFDVLVYGDGRREWTPFYPQKGTVRSNLRLELGKNIVDLGYQGTGRNQGTKVWATGGSNGDIKFENNFEDAALSTEYGQIEKIVSEGSQQDVNWLLDRATEEVQAEGRPIPIPELIVKDIPNAKLEGVLTTGDTVPVIVDHGGIQLDGNYRIVKIRRIRKGRLGLTVNRAA